jgi:hypothetical protein
MSDKLTPKQTLLMWCLLGCRGEALQRSIVRGLRQMIERFWLLAV